MGLHVVLTTYYDTSQNHSLVTEWYLYTQVVCKKPIKKMNLQAIFLTCVITMTMAQHPFWLGCPPGQAGCDIGATIGANPVEGG